MIWRTGTGLTAPLRLVVRKSQKTLGQKKPSMEAPTCPGSVDQWSASVL